MGQTVKEKQVLSICNVPEDYICVNSGLGEAPPRNIIVVPFVQEGVVRGALELGSFEPFDENTVLLLENVSTAVAIAINSAFDRIKMQDLLEEAQRSGEEAQSQAKEIKAANQELEIQNNKIRESEAELKSQQEELQTSNEELEEKTQYLEEQKEAMQEKNNEIEKSKNQIAEKAKDLAMSSRYKSEFLANMSHELRTPLNSLLILSKSLSDNKEDNLTDRQIESAKIIHNGGCDLLDLINDILDLSKVESGKMTLCIEEVEVDYIAKDINTKFEPLSRDKNFNFEIKVADDLPKTFETDRQRTLQILKNLLSNAFKFTQQGSVTLSIAKPGRDTQFKQAHLTVHNSIGFSITDTGIGIAKDKQRMIFEAFQQADGSTSRDFGGTGLGLTISRELCRLLGSELQISSAHHKGSTFTIYLPLENDGKYGERELSAASSISFIGLQSVLSSSMSTLAPTTYLSNTSADEQELAKITANIANYSAPVLIADDRDKLSANTKSLMIVEDDRDFAAVLLGIAKQKDYMCIVAGDGKSALHMAMQYKPSAILLDLGLPDIDGLKIMDILKQDIKTRHIPIHVISGRSDVGNLMNLGAVGYLQKPTSSEEFEQVFAVFDRYVDKRFKTMLIVEDDETYSNTLRDLLQTNELKVDQSTTGEDTIAKVKTHDYDCMIIDLSLPDMTGQELLKQLKKQMKHLPPIIVNTGKDLSEEEYKKIAKDSRDIVIKGSNSTDRLLDEVALFLHQTESSLSDKQKKVVKLLHDENILLQGHTVLLVDDMRNIFALTNVLEEAGLVVVSAENGQIALDLLAINADIELVMMDIMMPVMDGYEAIAKIREQDKFKKLPVIALTAKAMAEDRAKCMEAGADDYMNKPVDTSKLLSLIKVSLFN